MPPTDTEQPGKVRSLDDQRKAEKQAPDGEPPETDQPEPDAPLEGEDDPAAGQEEPEALVLFGTAPKPSNTIGGGTPDKSTCSFFGLGEFEVDGRFDRGDQIRTLQLATVEEGGVRDHRDRAAGTVNGSTRKHKAHVDRCIQINEKQWSQIADILGIE